VAYTYDSWGKQLAYTGTLANTLGAANPLRYRGYIYDSETGLYYLQSRYYSPDWGRFINADGLLGSIGSIKSHNIFEYCGNSPIMLSDGSGYVPNYNVTMTDGSGERGFASLMMAENCNELFNVGDDGHLITNTSEIAVLEAKVFAFYRGRLVIKLPIGINAASFGIMFLGTGLKNSGDPTVTANNVNTVKHEYGHTIQFLYLGVILYTTYVATPSVTCNLLNRKGLLPFDYYSSPWEHQADIYGSVNRRPDFKTFGFYGVYTSFAK